MNQHPDRKKNRFIKFIQRRKSFPSSNQPANDDQWMKHHYD